MKRLPVIGVLCVSAVLGLAACSDSSDDNSAAEQATQAAADLCTDLNALKADNAKLKALNPATATKDQVKDAYEAVQKDWENVKGNISELKQAEQDAVKQAAENLKKGYEDLPGDTTGKDAVTQLQPQIQSLDQASTAAATGLKC
ncbi:type IV pili methyl-accepting chemotaxis transducer N-terminal domain-containing protein [Streptomyces sp. NPDC090077]|uniref:type IV pili methyl-accepting chemotaxis transducer N-terminal domain-containing protein n=1 Tax=Streptomyces sp. NPDC090077 TaxID=3365938 RepID=UPI00381F122C